MHAMMTMAMVRMTRMKMATSMAFLNGVGGGRMDSRLCGEGNGRGRDDWRSAWRSGSSVQIVRRAGGGGGDGVVAVVAVGFGVWGG